MTNNNLFFEYVVKAKPGSDFFVKMTLCICGFIIGMMCFLFGGAISGLVTVIGLVVAFTGIGFFCYYISERKLEYEYSFTNGTIEVAAVYNLSRRKELFSFEMDQVTMIMPANSKRIANEKFNKVRDYTSRKKDHKPIAVVVDTEKAKQLVYIEINEKALDYFKMVARTKMYND